MRYKLTVNGANYDVEVRPQVGGKLEVIVNGHPYEVEREDSKGLSTQSLRPTKSPKKEIGPLKAAKVGGVDSTNKIVTKLPGRVVSVKVKAGDKVEKGDVLFVIESMKMQNNIVSPKNGTIGKVFVVVGQSVQRGQVLAEFT